MILSARRTTSFRSVGWRLGGVWRAKSSSPRTISRQRLVSRTMTSRSRRSSLSSGARFSWKEALVSTPVSGLLISCATPGGQPADRGELVRLRELALRVGEPRRHLVEGAREIAELVARA